MAKIAMELDRALARRAETGSPGGTDARILAAGEGWTVADVVCTSGPRDPPFEEQHTRYSIAVVAAGCFQYRSALGRELMTPGSLMLGSAGECFECGHEHGEGDRCVSFWYDPQYFERLAADTGARGSRRWFSAARIPALRGLSPVVARVCAALDGAGDVAWQQLGIEVATQTLQLMAPRAGASTRTPPGAEARVARVVRTIERRAAEDLTLDALARNAGLSPFHFLRVFERLTGVTPHQYLRRARLRGAASRLAADGTPILDIALDSGFGDVSNFNHAFRAEFGVSPRAFRRNQATASSPA